jgi:hypothetical protein
MNIFIKFFFLSFFKLNKYCFYKKNLYFFLKKTKINRKTIINENESLDETLNSILISFSVKI